MAWELCADECGEDACNEMIWEGGPIPEPWGEQWLKYEDQAKRLIAMVQKNTPPQPAQEPVAWMRPSEEGYDSAFRDHSTVMVCTGNPWTGWIPLYTAPPQRTWVGLTDEDDIDWEEGGNLKDLVKAIEAKLREKNT
jgi:hypothetical protein